jgi:outer membrane protein TolC
MESTTLSVLSRFLNLLRISDRNVINEDLVAISNERMQRARDNYGYGTFTRLQLLNAEVDLRIDSVRLAESNLEKIQAFRELNLVIGLPADTSYAIDSTFAFVANLGRDALLEGARNKNSQFLLARNEVYSAEQLLGANKADRMPTLNFQGGYSYNYNNFEASFLDQQETAGWNAGLSLRFYLFDGGRIQRNIENARLTSQIAQVEQERTFNEMAKLINNAFDSYTTSIALFNLSRRNLDLAVANFERSRDAFNTGQISGIELREAQINLAQARYEISSRRIMAKLAEAGLLFEAGALLE